MHRRVQFFIILTGAGFLIALLISSWLPQSWLKKSWRAIWDTDFLERGSTCEDNGDLSDAIKAYSKEIQLHPDSPIGYSSRARVYEKQGDLIGALKDFDKAIELRPNSFTRNLRGAVRSRTGDLTGAREDFDQALKENPQLAYVYYNRALLNLREKKIPEAQDDLQKCVDLDPSFFPLLRRAFDEAGVSLHPPRRPEG